MPHAVKPLSFVAIVLMCAGAARADSDGPAHAALDASAAERFAALALKCLHQEYPNKISHTMDGDTDAQPPRELFPAFHGCYDWHSAVHGHWLLVRLLRKFPDAPFAATARAELAAASSARTSRARCLTCSAPGARLSSGPMDWRGCCNSLRSCAPGTIHRASCGHGISRRWKRKPRRASSDGCRICVIRFVSVSTTRRRSPSG